MAAAGMVRARTMLVRAARADDANAVAGRVVQWWCDGEGEGWGKGRGDDDNHHDRAVMAGTGRTKKYCVKEGGRRLDPISIPFPITLKPLPDPRRTGAPPPPHTHTLHDGGVHHAGRQGAAV